MMERKDFKILWMDISHLGNEQFLQAVSYLASHMGFSIDICKIFDSKEALKRINDKDALVIHIGTVIPHPHGIEIIRQVKNNAKCLVILISGFDEGTAKDWWDEETTKLLDGYIDYFMPWLDIKPGEFIHDCLARRIQKIIDQESEKEKWR